MSLYCGKRNAKAMRTKIVTLSLLGSSVIARAQSIQWIRDAGSSTSTHDHKLEHHRRERMDRGHLLREGRRPHATHRHSTLIAMKHLIATALLSNALITATAQPV